MKKFINQYILVKKSNIEKVKGEWNIELINNYALFTNNQLDKYVHCVDNSTTLILIGFAFDIHDAKKKENDIIVNAPSNEEKLLEYSNQLCGNFAIILVKNDSLIMFNDAIGVLKIFYFTNNDDKIEAIASDPKLLKTYFHIEKNLDSNFSSFYKSKYFEKNKIRVGNTTSFKNVYQLLPNHKLDVVNNNISRFFPNKNRKEKKIDDAICQLHAYLTNVIKAVKNRHNIKCSLTAGWDSRMLLCITKPYKDDVKYFTFKKSFHKENHHDFRIAKSMANKINMDYNLIEIDNDYNQSGLLDIAKESYELIHPLRFDHIINGFTNFNDSDDIILTGLGSEICKNYYENIKVTNGITLAKAAHYPLNEFVTEHFQSKYKELRKVCDKYNYNINDIAHWEQDITNFAAQAIFYDSFVVKSLSPFNCRTIIDTVLSVKSKYRDKQQHRFYKKYLKKYWPVLNTFPINPTFKKRLIVIAKKMGIYKPYQLLNSIIKD